MLSRCCRRQASHGAASPTTSGLQGHSAGGVRARPQQRQRGGASCSRAPHHGLCPHVRLRPDRVRRPLQMTTYCFALVLAQYPGGACLQRGSMLCWQHSHKGAQPRRSAQQERSTQVCGGARPRRAQHRGLWRSAAPPVKAPRFSCERGGERPGHQLGAALRVVWRYAHAPGGHDALPCPQCNHLCNILKQSRDIVHAPVLAGFPYRVSPLLRGFARI